MKKHKEILAAIAVLTAITSGARMLPAQQAPASGTVPVHMVVTVEPTKKNPAPADLTREDVMVRQGKDRLKVTDWVPARGEQAALQLFLLIDDTCDNTFGSYLEDLRTFINAQPPTTLIAVGYMRNTTVTITQDFTSDHDLLDKAVRLPLGSTSAMDSPYLSLIDLVKRWPESKVRREVVMVSDGIDRVRGLGPSGSRPYGGGGYGGAGYGAGFGGSPHSMSTMPTISPDVDSASNVSQRYSVIVHTIYARGVGRPSRNFYEGQNGLNGLAKLSEETGGESFALSTQNAVSFQPYMERLQTILDSQEYVAFLAKPGKKAGLQRVKISTEVPNVEIVAADNVWVPVTAESTQKK